MWNKLTACITVQFERESWIIIFMTLSCRVVSVCKTSRRLRREIVCELSAISKLYTRAVVEVQWADYPIDYVMSLFFLSALIVISHFPFFFRATRAKTKVKKRIYICLRFDSEGKRSGEWERWRHIKIHEMCLWLFSLKGITFHCRSPFGA